MGHAQQTQLVNMLRETAKLLELSEPGTASYYFNLGHFEAIKRACILFRVPSSITDPAIDQGIYEARLCSR